LEQIEREIAVKKFGLTVLALAAFASGSAMAADMAARPVYTKAPAPAPVADWSGFYIGVNGGYGWGTTTDTAGTGPSDFALGGVAVPGGSFGGVPGESFSHNSSGGIAGGHIGYNWQVSNWLLGLETSADWTNIQGNTGGVAVTFPPTAAATTDSFSSNLRWVATATPRLGVVWNTWLLYVKGGLAAGQLDTSVTRLTGAATGTALNTTLQRVGWTIGGGVEYAVTRNWIFGVEGNYYDFGTQSYGGTGTSAAGGLTVSPVTETSKFTFADVLGRISYKFDAGGPVVARY
jgi:outer membrane immunogenic protein